MGVSIGAVVAALFTNGKEPAEIGDILKELFKNSIFDIFDPKNWVRNVRDGKQDWKLWLKVIAPPLNPLRWFGLPLLDMLPVMRELVEKYDLKPNPHLKIVAFDLIRRKPVVFEGTDYDLAVALAASCTVWGPAMMRPVPCWYKGSYYLLVDGGFFHPQPGILNEGRAIIAKLIDNPFLELLFADRKGDLVVSLSDHFESFFSALTDEDVERMHAQGHSRTHEALSAPLRRGLIPTYQPASS
jgi:hypothetical protein